MLALILNDKPYPSCFSFVAANAVLLVALGCSPAQTKAPEAAKAATQSPQDQAVAKWADVEKLLQQYHKNELSDSPTGAEVTFQSDVKKSESLTSPFDAYLKALYTYNPKKPQYALNKHVFVWKNGRWVHDSSYYTETQNWQSSSVDFEKQGLLTQRKFGGQFPSPASKKFQEFLQKNGLSE